MTALRASFVFNCSHHGCTAWLVQVVACGVLFWQMRRVGSSPLTRLALPVTTNEHTELTRHPVQLVDRLISLEVGGRLEELRIFRVRTVHEREQGLHSIAGYVDSTGKGVGNVNEAERVLSVRLVGPFGFIEESMHHLTY